MSGQTKGRREGWSFYLSIIPLVISMIIMSCMLGLAISNMFDKPLLDGLILGLTVEAMIIVHIFLISLINANTDPDPLKELRGLFYSTFAQATLTASEKVG